MQQLLSGVRILDLSKATAGPFATQVLADIGAEVIKIEEPPGPLGRSLLEPDKLPGGGMDPYFLSINRNKKSVVLPLAHSDGLATFYQLVERSDVVMDNFRPGVVEKLKVDYDSLSAINPSIITCSLTGYGKDGPMARRTAFDITVLAEAGMIDYVGKCDAQGKLAYPNVAIADLLAGMYSAVAVPAALEQRHRTGRGCKIDVAMYDSVLSLYIGYAINLLNYGQASHYFEGALWAVFETKTRPLVISAHRAAQWQRFCHALGRTEWLADDRFKTAAGRTENIAALKEIVTEVLRARPAEEWIAIFEAEGVPYGEIRTVDEALRSSQTSASKMVVDVEFPEGPVRLLGNPIKVAGADQRYLPPPVYGEHTGSVLQEVLGYDDDQVAAVVDLARQEEEGAA
jgi:crotonobetainyl-CoA:carnitine CoA-transferase CaiB-like acyl-CoA transferase